MTANGNEEHKLSIPAIQQLRIGLYIAARLIRGERRFPLVLMLEPLFQCNLRCRGCGKITYPPKTLARRLSVAACVAAAEECGAPVVSIAGGEPLLHPEAPAIVRALTARRRFVYLCTNALLISRQVDAFTPSPYLTFNVHIDGLRTRHDGLVGRSGVFDTAVAAIRLLIERGFRVTTNTTFFGGETPENASRLLDFLTALEVEGMTVAAAFGYPNAPDQSQFLDRAATVRLFRRLFAIGRRRWKFNHSSLYLDFLAGRQDYACTPWGNPTRNIFGWQKPCYLLNDGYAGSFRELMTSVDWNRYGIGRDPRCTDCMVHCGFEATAVMDTLQHPFKALKTRLRG